MQEGGDIEPGVQDPLGAQEVEGDRVRLAQLGRRVREGAQPVEVVVETDYNLIPFLGQKTQFATVKIRGTAVMRLEQNYTMATGCTS